jgi:hypothetical protein
MKHALLWLCLTAAALSAPTPLDLSRVWNLEGDVAMAVPSSLNCIPSTELVVPSSDQHEVHAVVVDMPQRASLEHASPETWGSLPTSARPYEQPPVMFQLAPYEQPPATPMLQLAMNAEVEGSN